MRIFSVAGIVRGRMLEDLLDYMEAKGDVWFATGEEMHAYCCER